jgi:succinate dehydrogenase assembly factor 2
MLQYATRGLGRQIYRPILQRTLFVSTPRSSDPWPLPHTPQHLSNTITPLDTPAPEPLPRLNETLETTRARLLYQSRKRGTLESDLLLSTFARDHLPTMSEAELKAYDKVLSFPYLSMLCVHLDQRDRLLLSCLMSPTGTYITGRQATARLLNDGPALQFWTDLEFMQRTRERWCGRCPLCHN